MSHFTILKKSKKSNARLSELKTAHGKINGPFFMTIATRGAVKNITVEELQALQAQIVLSNTYHLLLRPGVQLMKKYGGLHKFMTWNGPILTDSGGFQVFSLSKHRKIDSKGVAFRDPQNGKDYYLTPQLAIQIQKAIGSDIMMVLDECPPYPVTEQYARQSLELTTAWAALCKKEHEEKKNGQLLFAIVQGSVYENLRKASARQLTQIGFDGYAIGGVAVGEPREKMHDVLRWTLPELPENKPRYLMGLGRPEEIVAAVRAGVDMFDCVIPTREARHGRLYVWKNEKNLTSKNFYTTINIANAKFAKDMSSINAGNLKKYTKAYLHHLFKTNEGLGLRLATLNNIAFYLRLMELLRVEIKRGKL